MYETAEQLQKAIQDYFDNPPTKDVLVGKGESQQVIKLPVLTITGLCYQLGFESRQSFYAYEDKPEFSYTIKRARLFIEHDYEKQLQIGNTTGAIFALKNFGWSDKQEFEHSGEVNTTGFDYSKLSNAALKELANASGSSE